jgi:uncharacterized membrane protein YeiH
MVKTELITTVLDLAGVFANALLGGGVARSQNLDLFGYVAMGLVSGLGGGIIRDVLLQRGTPVALVNPAYIITALAGVLVAFVLNIQHKYWDRIFTIVDAAALSLWATAGAQKTLSAGLDGLSAVLLGTVTAVGGGVSRDLMMQRVPAVFGGNALYASVAVVVATLQVVVSEVFGAHFATGTFVAIAGGFALRLIAHWRGWSLPGGLDWRPRQTVTKIAQRVRRDPGDPGGGVQG